MAKKGASRQVRDHLEQITHEEAQENGWQFVELAIQPDHVHLCIQTIPYTLPTAIARLIKGHSSHDLREAFPHLCTYRLCGQEAHAIQRLALSFRTLFKGISRGRARANVDLRVQTSWEQRTIRRYR
jgi:hypothetical protein